MDAMYKLFSGSLECSGGIFILLYILRIIYKERQHHNIRRLLRDDANVVEICDGKLVVKRQRKNSIRRSERLEFKRQSPLEREL